VPPSATKPTPSPSTAPESAPPVERAGTAAAAPAANLKDALLGEIRKSNPIMYNTLVAQAQRIDVSGDRIVLTFAAAQKITPTFDKYKPALEAAATRLAGRRIAVASEIVAGDAKAASENGGAPAPSADAEKKKSALKEQALADPGVQSLLEVFPAEIRDVEEM
jgi:hypothetical protein